MDFWAGTFGLVVFAMIEVILFAWIFGMKRAWAEMNAGADIRIPKIFKFIIRFVTPVYLIGLLVFWSIQEGIPKLFMHQTDIEMITYDGSTSTLVLQKGKVQTGEIILKNITSVQDSVLTKDPKAPNFSLSRDYEVNLQTGELTITPGSTIPVGTKLAISHVYVNNNDLPFKWGARLMMLALIAGSVLLIIHAYKKGTIRHETANS
jgi:hypothetical protein